MNTTSFFRVSLSSMSAPSIPIDEITPILYVIIFWPWYIDWHVFQSTASDSLLRIVCSTWQVLSCLLFIWYSHCFLALSIYDTVINLSKEVRCIWQRKRSMATVLYVSIRYGVILDILIPQLSYFFISRTVAVSVIVSSGPPSYYRKSLGVGFFLPSRTLLHLTNLRLDAKLWIIPVPLWDYGGSLRT